MAEAPQRLSLVEPSAVTPRRQLPTALTDVLADLATALTFDAVADAVVRHARALTGARASALGLVTDTGTELVLVGSHGYDCTTMGVGARLPLDSGLPITEAARTGAPVVRRQASDGWVAVPLAARSDAAIGALLVSLAGEPAGGGLGLVGVDGNVDGDINADVELITTLASYGRQALHRTHGWRAATRAGASLAGASGGSAGQPIGRRLDVAIRRHARLPGLGGDLVRDFLVDEDTWLFVADVCGSDSEAAATAHIVDEHLPRLVARAGEPATLLTELACVLDASGQDRYVTALALRLSPQWSGAVTVTGASAGHVLPLVCRAGGGAAGSAEAAALPVPLPFPAASDATIGVPLNIGLPAAPLRPFAVSLRPGDSLVAFTDGLVDRADGLLAADDVGEMVLRAATLQTADAALEVLLDVLTATAGESRDDLAAVWARVR